VINKPIQLPVPILNDPHWRVIIRPDEYIENLISSLSTCRNIIEKNKLRLRGWDYPHLSNNIDTGKNYFASWCDLRRHKEYWRFYQSGQFIHLFSVRESIDTDWKQELEKAMQSHLNGMVIVDWNQDPGYFSILNIIYTITEIYEFAARLCQAQIYKGKINIDIKINGICGFVLAMEVGRVWYNYYKSSVDDIGNTWTYDTDILVADSSNKALEAIYWLFEKFGWLDQPKESIKRDQEHFIKGLF